jgi:hypothetical protein
VWTRQALHKEIAMGCHGYEGSVLQRFIHVSIAYLAPVILGIISGLTVLDHFFSITVVV